MRGDGKRFMGRGLIQLAGRANYRAYGKRLALDLEGNPEMAAAPGISLQIACEYWKVKGLNALAERDDIEGITRRINGGTNGLADRRRYLAKAREIWGAAVPVPVPRSDTDHKALERGMRPADPTSSLLCFGIKNNCELTEPGCRMPVV